MRNLHHPVTGDMLDAGAGVIAFPHDQSYTGEESLELHVHGGIATVSDVLDALACKGRPAEPGEFTRRAFENDRMDLTASEALHSLVNAETSVQRRVALQGAGGLQTARYEAIRTTSLEAMALVEALIDFGEEDSVENGTWSAAKEKVTAMITLVRSELGSEQHGSNKRHVGEIVTQGIKLALYGPPNAGKSSLLNRLADRRAAIVSPVPGTTRDVLNVNLDLGGYKVVVYDTAGLRKTAHEADMVEQIGMERARDAVRDSDIALLVAPVDSAAEALRPESYVATEPDLVFYNKTDLLGEAKNLPSAHTQAWYGSVKTDDGISDLIHGLQSVIKRKYSEAVKEPLLITQTRHRYHLHESLKHLSQFQQYARSNDPDLVLAAEELRHAAQAVGKITGRHVNPDEILGTIFSTFCIGK